MRKPGSWQGKRYNLESFTHQNAQSQLPFEKVLRTSAVQFV